MKTEPITPLTRLAKIAMLRALAAGGFNEEGRAILNDFLNPGGAITVEVIDNRLQLDGLTNDEFETVIQKVRREQFGGSSRDGRDKAQRAKKK